MGSDPFLSVPAKLNRSFLQTVGFELLTALVATGWGVALPNKCPALVPDDQQATEEQFIDGLLARRLFPLAVLACEERLAGNSIHPCSPL